GQPIVDPFTQYETNVWEKRAGAIYDEDRSIEIRRSHENPYIKKLYDEYLGEPNGHKAHHLLHTTYTARPKYEEDYLSKETIGISE
ncbi:MAG: iron hydrogenase small subunit, partial [Clostridiales bacterium]|nr:iron hydrogenase small subunit [Clostridiales bacterium]